MTKETGAVGIAADKRHRVRVARRGMPKMHCNSAKGELVQEAERPMFGTFRPGSAHELKNVPIEANASQSEGLCGIVVQLD